MGIFDNFFGGTKDQTSTTTSSTNYNLPDWLKQYLDQNGQAGISALQGLAGTTADQRIQGFTPDELAAQERVRQGTGQYDDIISGALSTLQQAQSKAFNGVDPADIQKFINPFTQNVTDITKREVVNDADIARAKNMAGANAASAFGGSGGLLRQEALDKNLSQNLSDIQYKGDYDAYNSALAAAQKSTTDSIAAGQAVGNLATTGANIYNTDTANLAASGESQRTLAQAKTDFTYTNPLQTILQGQQLVAGAAPLYGQTNQGSSTQQVPYSGWGSQLLGGALAVGSLGTGGGSTILSGLLKMNTPAVGKKDGGAVKMADGGEPLSKMLKMLGTDNDAGSSSLVRRVLSPTENAVYNPGDLIPFNYDTSPSAQLANETGVPDFIKRIMENNKNSTLNPQEQVLSDRMDAEAAANNQGISDPSQLPEGVMMPPEVGNKAESSNDSPSSMVDSVLDSGKLAGIYGNTPIADAGVAALASGDKPIEKTRLQKMIDDTNLPLLKMGLTMMGSNKPFFGALSEGGLAGAGQIEKDRESEEKAKQEADKLAVDKEKNRITEDYNKGRITNAQARTALDALKAPADIAYKTSLSNKMNQTSLTIKNQLDSIDKEYANLSRQYSASFDNKEKAQIKSAMDKNRADRIALVKGAVASDSADSKTNLQDETNKAVQRQLDFSELPD